MYSFKEDTILKSSSIIYYTLEVLFSLTVIASEVFSYIGIPWIDSDYYLNFIFHYVYVVYTSSKGITSPNKLWNIELFSVLLLSEPWLGINPASLDPKSYCLSTELLSILYRSHSFRFYFWIKTFSISRPTNWRPHRTSPLLVPISVGFPLNYS